MTAPLDWEKIALGLVAAVSGLVTAWSVLKGKRGDNLSSDQDSFRKSYLSENKGLLADRERLLMDNVVKAIKVADLERELNEARERIAELEGGNHGG